MAGMAGKDGSIFIGANTDGAMMYNIHKVTSWDWNEVANINPATLKDGKGFNDYELGTKGATFTYAAFLDYSEVNAVPPNVDTIIKFDLRTNDLLRLYYDGTAIITSVTFGVPVDGVINYTAGATVKGAWTRGGTSSPPWEVT